MANVVTGLDRLVNEPALIERLRGKSVALLVNPTSVTAQLAHAIDALLGRGLQITKLFGPEHGVRGEHDDGAQQCGYA